jgi:hypothetical protein
MTDLTRDILKFYKYNEKNSWYLTKFFSETKNIGYYSPYQEVGITGTKEENQKYAATIDEDNTYKINGLGFRGKINEGADALGVGCSITFGLGVPESGRWTDILANNLGKSVNNLGSPGASVATICKNIIQYCLINGMPKEIFCLMPDFFRRMVVVDKEFYTSKKGTDRNSPGKGDHLELFFCNPRVAKYEDSIFMEIEDKKYIEDSISPHQLILDSVEYLYILESFCLTNGIKLYWTTWDRPSSLIMNELSKIKDFKLKRYTNLFSETTAYGYDPSFNNTCNSDHNSEFKDSSWWSLGSDYSIIDYKKTNKYSHPGIHFHYHVSDLFYELHKKDSNN